MENRKYFKHRIVELEAVYESAEGNFAVLEELEEELAYRSTQRARKLLKSVQDSLSGEAISSSEVKPANPTVSPAKTAAPANEAISDDKPIDWDEVLSSAPDVAANLNDEGLEQKPLNNDPLDILSTWTALEALSPQSYKKPKDLVIGRGSIAYLRPGQEPWLKGEKSIPKNNLYYLVYLGAVDMEKVTAQLLSIYQDKRIEKPQVKGFAALGVILLDKKGVPVPDSGLAISSFGWAYMMAMKQRLSELKYWDVSENSLKEGLEKIIYKQNEEGEALPFSLDKAQQAFSWIVRNCEIPESESVAPSFAIRLYQPFSKGEPEAPLLNSFYFDDLQRAKQAVEAGLCGNALSQFLGIKEPKIKHDVLEDKTYIEKALQPKNMPLARWPGKGRHSLVLLQQSAVNLALQELEDDGLFSVNGPPGTGKTTLLRDVVSAVLIKRAKALVRFKNAEDAFEHAGKMKLGASFLHLYKLDESLRGHEILVASSNNKAVENISKELPQKSQVAEDIGDLNYFKTISDALASDGEDNETWGAIAAVLGKSKNRGAFVDAAWWDKNSGLQYYFKYISGQLSFEVDDEGNDIVPKIISECDPPKNLEEAKSRWGRARKEFSVALDASEKMTFYAQSAYESYHLVGKLKADLANNKSMQTELQEIITSAREKETALSSETKLAEADILSQEGQEKLSLSKKPGFFKRIFSRSKWRSWKEDHEEVLSKLIALRQAYKDILAKCKETAQKLKQLEVQFEEVQLKEKAIEAKLSDALSKLEKYSSICGGKLVTPNLWLRTHEEQQVFSPNFTDQAQRLRDDVFIAAVKLHKAFIDASSKKLRQNLAVYFACLKGASLPEDKQNLLSHLWSSAFLTVPVMSTTFASVGRMLERLPKESLGWLLIDEAGQAPPQQAIGAIYRAKRVMSVGDPLQIEPVVTLPPSIVESMSKHLGVDPNDWVAPDASVQTLSDAANIYGTTIPRDLSEIRIGTPLLVHRRCEDPMFSISNKLAYSGLMVHATAKKKSEITDIFGSQSVWFDIRGGAQEKWCPEEGEHVCKMLLQACEHFADDPDIFVITPFKIVAEKMRRRMESEKDTLFQLGISEPSGWISDNIGTVHTFQGKEAKAVILLLGAPSPAQDGARRWATGSVNLLNVAVSRAKQNFYVVGNRELWGELGHMKQISRYVS